MAPGPSDKPAAAVACVVPSNGDAKEESGTTLFPLSMSPKEEEEESETLQADEDEESSLSLSTVGAEDVRTFSITTTGGKKGGKKTIRVLEKADGGAAALPSSTLDHAFPATVCAQERLIQAPSRVRVVNVANSDDNNHVLKFSRLDWPFLAFIICITTLWDGIIFTSIIAFGAWWLVFLPHTWVGVLLLCVCIIGVVNRTYITITDKKVHVQDRPIRCHFCCCGLTENSTVPLDNVTEFICKRGIRINKHGKKVIHYAVVAVRLDEEAIPVVSDIDTLDCALFIQQELQDFLARRGIANC